MKLLMIILFWCYCLLPNIYGARILGLFHVSTISHTEMGFTLLNSLAERGHQVTIVSGLDPKLNNSNVKYIYLDGTFKILADFRHSFSQFGSGNHIGFYIQIDHLTNDLTENALQSNVMKKLMSSGEQFDIVFIEPFLNQALIGLGHYFNAQVIVLSAGNSFYVNELSGNVAPYSFVPSSATPYTDKMNFQERLFNTYHYLMYHISNKLYKEPFQKKIYEEYFPNALDYDKAIRNVSLHFVNTHTIYESPRPYLPNMIPVGGIHVKSPKKLSKDIQEYLDNANEGAILFSLGSYLQGKDIPDEKKQAILKTFAKLPQRILWKFEDELPGKPENVKISKWFPQGDILAHPNLILFISHGGLLSTIEALHRGVPVLGIPFYSDQFGNIAQLTASGCGQSLLFSDLTEENFFFKIQQILNNSSYSKNIKRASQILRDQPETPLERAVFWTEHILKHGSNHLRSASIDLSIMEYLLLDIIAFVVSLMLLFPLVLYVVLKVIWKNVFKYKHNKQD